MYDDDDLPHTRKREEWEGWKEYRRKMEGGEGHQDHHYVKEQKREDRIE